MENQVFTWFSISTRKKTLRSGPSTTTKSAILASGNSVEGMNPLFWPLQTVLVRKSVLDR
jgi:hypothetical protein